MMLLIINRHDEAAPYFDIARTNASRAGDDITMGIASEIEVIVPNWRGRYGDALRQWRPSTGSGGGPAIEVMVNLAQAWAASLALGGAGRYEEAIETLSMVIAHAERVGDAFYRLRAMNSLGWVYLELQDVDRGREWNARMLDTADQLGLHDPEIDSNARLNLADVHIARGDLDAAEVELRRVEAIYRSPSPRDRWMLWRYAQHMLHSYGELHLLRGDGEKAAGYARECITLAEKSSALKNVIKGRRLLGRVHAARGNTDDAERELSAALDVARDVSNPTQLWKTYEAIADLCAASGRAAEASAAWSKAASVIDGVASALRDASLRSTFLGSPDVSRILAKR
jgi:tetratricopeptide (TPR) repeat protein